MMDPKRIAAEKATEYVQDGMLVGLGTGSTATWAIRSLGEKVKAGLKVRAVASSVQSEELARQLGIPILPLEEISSIDLTIDGADEADPEHHLIKGGGGALLREKILAYHSSTFIVVVDETKLVQRLGRFPLPVEIVPFAANLTLNLLQGLGCRAGIRRHEDRTYRTDNGNLIADCHFGEIPDPEGLNRAILLLPGVVECGIFPRALVSRIVAGYADGSIRELA